MTKKSVKVEGANLTTTQKEELKRQILKEFPMLKMLEDDIVFLIEEYNKDKKYLSKLMKAKTPMEQIIDESKFEKIKVLKANTEEWREVVEKMERSKDEFVTINPDETLQISNE